MADREFNEMGLPPVSREARQVKAALSAMQLKTDRNDARGRSRR